jgi:hypothetical protein
MKSVSVSKKKKYVKTIPTNTTIPLTMIITGMRRIPKIYPAPPHFK